jgi:hypothetical protein
VKKILLLLGAFLLMASAATTISAQVGINLSKNTYTADVGSSDTGTLTLTGLSQYTTLDGVTVEDLTGVFTLEDVPSTPSPLLPGFPVEITVVFSPLEEGSFSATLIVSYSYFDFSSMTLVQKTEELPLHGQGIESSSPTDMIAELITYYDQALNDGSIYGVGRGRSAPQKALAVRHLLYSAQWLIDAGHLRWARLVLESVARHTDGALRPKDFVDGPGLAEFHSKLMDLIAALE